MTIKKLRFVFTSLLSMMAFLFIACDNDDDFDDDDRFDDDGIGVVKGTVNMKASAIYNGTTGKNIVFKTANSNMEIHEFLANISEIELEFDDDQGSWHDEGYYGSDDELELKGPFELNLLAGEAVFASVNIPRATFEEIEFEFDRSRDESSDLHGKTVLMGGIIEDVPFEFWYDFEEDAEVDFDDSDVDITITGSDNEITITFDLDEVFDITTGIDLSSAQDGNGDGLIEVNPNDDDGNRNLARRLKEKLEDSIELLDD